MPLVLKEQDWINIFPKAPNEIIEAFVKNIDWLHDAGITGNRSRLAYALANVEHECNGYTIKNLTENINYSAERMAKVWPNRFSSASDVKNKYGTGRGWRKRAFNDIYGRKSLGNRPGTDDGSTYIGRGGPQITGRSGYRAVGLRSELDLENNPELATLPENQPAILAAFWSWKKLQGYADKGDFIGCVKKWNGGLNGIKDRKERLKGNEPIIMRLNNVARFLPNLELV